MDNLTLEELKEIKLSLNEMQSRRIQYNLEVRNEKLKDLNNKYLEMDRNLLKRVLGNIDKLKEQEEC